MRESRWSVSFAELSVREALIKLGSCCKHSVLDKPGSMCSAPKLGTKFMRLQEFLQTRTLQCNRGMNCDIAITFSLLVPTNNFILIS
ncbi:hypothetical protein OWV82_000843 [Melia azedarach]|uniref:Uncharacterized protein n=1 Tax=Melia azedarach TaxID=155640 RepID=A0ACC1YW98_MELAZ|nr:hypothetical protein OWV82_000843 [Melia azedarach]